MHNLPICPSTSRVKFPKKGTGRAKGKEHRHVSCDLSYCLMSCDTWFAVKADELSRVSFNLKGLLLLRRAIKGLTECWDRNTIMEERVLIGLVHLIELQLKVNNNTKFLQGFSFQSFHILYLYYIFYIPNLTVTHTYPLLIDPENHIDSHKTSAALCMSCHNRKNRKVTSQ